MQTRAAAIYSGLLAFVLFCGTILVWHLREHTASSQIAYVPTLLTLCVLGVGPFVIQSFQLYRWQTGLLIKFFVTAICAFILIYAYLFIGGLLAPCVLRTEFPTIVDMLMTRVWDIFFTCLFLQVFAFLAFNGAPKLAFRILALFFLATGLFDLFRLSLPGGSTEVLDIGAACILMPSLNKW